MPELVIKDLVVEYTSGDYVVRPFDGFHLRLAPGTLALLLGPSGCGKTTLLSALAGILTPSAGSIRYGDTEVVGLSGRALTEYRRRGVGVVFQAFNLVPSLDAVENVMIPMLSAGVGRRPARERAEQLLSGVGLAERLHHRPGEMSGGQQQRVAIARALGLDPPLVLADEPTAHLDHVQVEGVLRIIRGLTDGGRVVVVATHDERMVALADEVVELAPRFAEAVLGPEERLLAPGEVLFREGTRGERIYVVDEGEIDLVRADPEGGEVLLAVRRPGEHFGEMGPLFSLPRSATARARTAARVTGYALKDFQQRFRLHSIEHLIRSPSMIPDGEEPQSLT
jgi:putative ABC transport system ATP-binding protein